MKSNFFSNTLLLLALLLSVFLSGCGADKSHLTGVVTLDGQPVPNCSLSFVSTSDGPSGGGATDSEGRYNAYISKNYLWLAPGEYKVDIQSLADMDAADGEPVDAGALRIPKKYQGTHTELLVTVEPGKNNVDFELTSD